MLQSQSSFLPLSPLLYGELLFLVNTKRFYRYVRSKGVRIKDFVLWSGGEKNSMIASYIRTKYIANKRP